MKAVVFEEFGSPRKVLRIEERPLPEPGPGQVRIKLVLSPLHNHDLMIVTGHYGYKPSLPHVPGTEALGIVDKLGEGVTNLKLGQRVTGGGSATWPCCGTRAHRCASTRTPCRWCRLRAVKARG